MQLSALINQAIGAIFIQIFSCAFNNGLTWGVGQCKPVAAPSALKLNGTSISPVRHCHRYSMPLSISSYAPAPVTPSYRELVEIGKTVAAAKDKHNAFLKELGLKLLP